MRSSIREITRTVRWLQNRQNHLIPRSANTTVSQTAPFGVRVRIQQAFDRDVVEQPQTLIMCRDAVEIYRDGMRRYVTEIPDRDTGGTVRGIVIPSGGMCYTYNRRNPLPYWKLSLCAVAALRDCGCSLPVELWVYDDEIPVDLSPLQAFSDISLRVVDRRSMRCPFGWQLKVQAVLCSQFDQVLLLDSDNIVAKDPTFLWDTPEFQDTGALFWDNLDNGTTTAWWSNYMTPWTWNKLGLDRTDTIRQWETGQFLVDKNKHYKPLMLAQWFGSYSEYWGGFNGLPRPVGKTVWYGDPGDIHAAWCVTESSFWAQHHMGWDNAGGYFQHFAPDGSLVFQHCCRAKYGLIAGNVPGLVNIDSVRRALGSCCA